MRRPQSLGLNGSRLVGTCRTAKLTFEKAQCIRAAHADGATAKELAAKWKVSEATIRNILGGWAYNYPLLKKAKDYS